MENRLILSIEQLLPLFQQTDDILKKLKAYRLVIQLLEHIWSKRTQGPLAMDIDKRTITFMFEEGSEIICFAPKFSFFRYISGGHFLDTIGNTNRRKNTIDTYQNIMSTISSYNDNWTPIAEKNSLQLLLNFWHQFFQLENKINCQIT